MLFKGIKVSKNWKNIEKINKGWSADEKYYVTDNEGKKFVLRISNKKKYEKRKREVDYLNQLSELDLNIPGVVEFGYCSNGEKVYKLLTFIEGKDLLKEIKNFTEEEQYELGVQSGVILKQIHSIQVGNDDYTWEDKYNKKIDNIIEKYAECPLSFEGSENVIKFINKNRKLLKSKNMTFNHGDYHIGNMIVDKNRRLGVIDFDRAGVGEAYKDFNKISWCGNISSQFATGRINGYFDNKVPKDFFKLVAIYIGVNQLSSLPWSILFGEKQVKIMRSEISKVMKSYDDFKTFIPVWYLGRKK